MWMFIYTLIFIFFAIIGMLAVQQALHLSSVRKQINLRLATMTENADVTTLFQQSSLIDKAHSTASSNFIWQHLQRLYRQSGLAWSSKQIVVYFAGLVITSYLLLALIMDDMGRHFLFTAMLALGLAYAYLVRLRAKRMRAFILALPDALGVVVRSLRAGHPLTEGVRMVADEMADPVGSEFRAMLNQLQIGAEPETAMINMYHSVGSNEVKLMAVTLSIQSGTGGNLAEVFEQLAETIRQRTMLAVKVKAISAEGRASAAIMSVFPLVLYGIISLAAPGYFDPVWESEYAMHMLTFCLTTIALGAFILMRMVDFDR